MWNWFLQASLLLIKFPELHEPKAYAIITGTNDTHCLARAGWKNFFWDWHLPINSSVVPHPQHSSHKHEVSNPHLRVRLGHTAAVWPFLYILFQHFNGCGNNNIFYTAWWHKSLLLNFVNLQLPALAPFLYNMWKCYIFMTCHKKFISWLRDIQAIADLYSLGKSSTWCTTNNQ